MIDYNAIIDHCNACPNIKQCMDVFEQSGCAEKISMYTDELPTLTGVDCEYFSKWPEAIKLYVWDAISYAMKQFREDETYEAWFAQKPSSL